MATNTKHNEIIKKIFKGNVGMQVQLLRKKIEVLEFQMNNEIITEEQQEYIDNVNLSYKSYDNKIKAYLNETTLEDLIEEMPVEEE